MYVNKKTQCEEIHAAGPHLKTELCSEDFVKRFRHQTKLPLNDIRVHQIVHALRLDFGSHRNVARFCH